MTDNNTPIGGSRYTEEVCKCCGKKWQRYRLGSFDWEYRDCGECEIKKVFNERIRNLAEREYWHRKFKL